MTDLPYDPSTINPGSLVTFTCPIPDCSFILKRTWLPHDPSGSAFGDPHCYMHDGPKPPVLVITKVEEEEMATDGPVEDAGTDWVASISVHLDRDGTIGTEFRPGVPLDVHGDNPRARALTDAAFALEENFMRYHRHVGGPVNAGPVVESEPTSFVVPAAPGVDERGINVLPSRDITPEQVPPSAFSPVVHDVTSTAPHEHHNPSPSQAVGAWCNGDGDHRGCSQFTPLDQFKSGEYLDPYFDDLRGFKLNDATIRWNGERWERVEDAGVSSAPTTEAVIRMARSCIKGRSERVAFDDWLQRERSSHSQESDA